MHHRQYLLQAQVDWKVLLGAFIDGQFDAEARLSVTLPHAHVEAA